MRCQSPRKQPFSSMALVLPHTTRGLAENVASGLNNQEANLCYM
jgi:hypothetical protein